MIRMKATKHLTYRTRRLLADGTSELTSRLAPGDVFEVMKPRDLKVLRATRKAEAMREPVDVPAPPPALAEKIAAAVAPVPPVEAVTHPGSGPVVHPGSAPAPAESDLAALRADYEKAVGKRPFMGWDAATLREKMAAASSS